MEFPYFIKLEGLLSIPPGFSALLCCLYLSVSSALLFAERAIPCSAAECLCTLKCLSGVADMPSACLKAKDLHSFLQ